MSQRTTPNTLVEKFDTLTPALQQWQKYQQKPLKWLYNALVPRSKRKAWQLQAKQQQKEHLAECWNELITLYHQNTLPLFDIKPKKQFAHQKIIWQYWGQGIDDNLPEIVKICFASVDKHKDDFTVIRLDDKNLGDYLELPDFVWQKRKNPEFKPAFFADLLRIALLYHYGGIWIDATILLTAPIDQQLQSQDFFMFSRHAEAENQDFWTQFNADYFGWHQHHYVNILNSFIIAKQHNPIIKDCLQILLNFWHSQNHIPHYFFFQIMFDVLMEKYADHYQEFLNIDDTLPHLLIAKLEQPFEQDEYDEIIARCQIHKLTYRQNCPTGSYYEHLKQQLLENQQSTPN